MPAKQESLKRITRQLATFQCEVKLHNHQGLTDINKHAEELFRAPLKLILGGEVSLLEYVKKDYPAIDLYCEAAKTGIQVTSTNTCEKIQHTLDEARRHLNGKQVNRLIVLIIGDKKNYRKSFTEPDWLHFSMQEDIWDLSDLLLRLEETCTAGQLYQLSEHLDYLNGDRAAVALSAIQAEIEQIMQAIEASKQARSSPRLHLSLPPEKPSFLHQKVLTLLTARLEQNSPIFITGPKGSGKETLAIHLGHRYEGGNVHFVRFDKSFTDTIIRAFSRGLIVDFDTGHLSQEELCNQALQRLYENDLVIIVDAAPMESFKFNDTGFHALCQKPIKLVITTEQDFSRIGMDTIRMMLPDHSEDLLVLMPQMKRDTDTLTALIRESDNHPGMVRRLAELLETYAIRPTELLAALRSGTLAENEKTAGLYDQFLAMVPISSLNENEQTVLRYLLLVRERMTEELFREELNDEAQYALDHLKRMGWLTVDKQSYLCFSSPVIRLVARTELKLSYDNCRRFLNRLAENVRIRCSCHESCTQIADCFDRAMSLFRDSAPVALRMQAVNIARFAGRRDKADEYEAPIPQQLINCQENRAYQDSFYAALTYLNRGEYQSARELMENALRTATLIDPIKGLPPIPPNDLAMIYHNCAALCEKCHAPEEAAGYYEQALNYFQEDFDKVDTYIQLSQLFAASEDPDKQECALQYAQDAVICAGDNAGALEKAHTNNARVHIHCHNYIRAPYSALEALKYRQKHLPPGDPLLNESLRLVTVACLKSATSCADQACTDNLYSDIIKDHFLQAQAYVNDAQTYAESIGADADILSAYKARIYAYHQAARGELRQGRASLAEEYLQEARIVFRQTPAEGRASLVRLAENLAKLYYDAMYAQADPAKPDVLLENWILVWEYCLDFESLSAYAQKIVLPNIKKSAEQYEKTLRTNFRSNLQQLLGFYKRMSDFFGRSGIEEQRNLYRQKLMELDNIVSAALQ